MPRLQCWRVKVSDLARLRYLDSARADLLHILDYITRESSSLVTAQRFIGLLRQTCKHHASLPAQLGRPRPELQTDVRSFSYRGYVIFFRYIDDVFEIINIIEGHRDFDSYFELETDE